MSESLRRLWCRLVGHRVVVDECMGMRFPFCIRCGKLEYRWGRA